MKVVYIRLRVYTIRISRVEFIIAVESPLYIINTHIDSCSTINNIFKENRLTKSYKI